MTAIERPEGTLDKEYARCKKNIMRWRKNNKEYIKEYNREYQRKLRSDPVKYQEISMRIATGSYLRGTWKNSYKVTSAMGMSRQQVASKHNMTENELINMLKTHEIDHIIPASWFNHSENIHLKPFQWRHYNIQFVKKQTNRTKHNYVDENDIRIKLVITLLKLDYHQSKNQYEKADVKMINQLADEANRLQTKIKNTYNNI